MTDLTVPNAQYNQDCAGPLIGPTNLISEFHCQCSTLLGLVSAPNLLGPRLSVSKSRTRYTTYTMGHAIKGMRLCSPVLHADIVRHRARHRLKVDAGG